MTSDEFRAMWERHWAYVGVDEGVVHEVYDDDAVLEFPQSGERFEGRTTFREWREKYPAKVDLELVRVSGSGDHWVAEGRIRYDDGPPSHTVALVAFRDGKVTHERIYISEGWDAADWRRPYRANRPADGSETIRDG